MIDIGANLTHDSFDADRDAVVARAHAAGVTSMVITGSTVAASEQAVLLAEQYRFYATAGVHPHHATEVDEDTAAQLGTLMRHPRTVAAGECGLDYFRNFSPRDVQLRAFELQLQLAVDAQLPVFLHQRDAEDPFFAVLQRYRDRLVDAVAHCFTGGPESLARCLDLDLYIGITGWICDERRGGALREAVSRIPVDRLMIETDAPYLLPRDLTPKPRTRRNEPMHLPHVLATLAQCRGDDAGDLAAATTANATRFFRLPAGLQESKRDE